MSTDSTELTFIRCPSCRSLVPAVSPRCRMCGAVLDAGKSDAAGSSEENKKVTSRVRQQTVSVSDRDLKAANEAYGQPNKTQGEQTNASSSAEDIEILQSGESEFFDDSDNPLRSEEKSEVSNSATLSPGMDSDDLTDFGDPLSAFIQEVPVEESEIQPAESDHPEDLNSNGFHESSVAEPAAQSFENPITEESRSQPSATSSFQPKRSSSETRPKVIIESGQRKQNVQKSALSFGKSRTESPSSSRAPIASKQRFTAPSDKAAGVDLQEGAQDGSFSGVDIYNEDSREKVSHEMADTQSHAGSKGPKFSEAPKGKLYGWLVSYSDPKGVALGLRDGKFFVSRASLKGSDLILDDDSISTPHAMFGVNVNDGLMVQDLMSDKGVFIRKHGTNAYQRILESTKLENGDWVRFGEVEFLVAILSVQTSS